MPDLTESYGKLAQADRHIAEAMARIVRQSRIVKHLAATGLDPTNAKRLLRDMEQTLHATRVHRCLIADDVSQPL